ncbi:MAG: ABC transporter ATP-binding protein [Gemmatimonadota bacterium]
MTSAIEVSGLQYRAGPGFSLTGVSLAVPTGSIYGFLGPNGSGKTTTIRLLLGHLRADAGTIQVLGESVPKNAERVLARIGYVPERPHLYGTLRVEEAIQYHASFYPTWDAGLAAELQRAFRLNGAMVLSRLSKGELGKLMMLLALSQRPELLVLDEPTDGLDPAARREVLSALVEFVAQRTATVFISSHLVHELERICDRVAILDGGRVVSELPIDILKSGMKRLRVAGVPRMLPAPPFTILTRDLEVAGSETWAVQNWQTQHAEWLLENGITLREVIDLDLEEGFVALLQSRAVLAQPASDSSDFARLST